MHSKTLAEAAAYEAPKHHGCSSFRLQGLDASPINDFWVGMSHFLPGGGTQADASPFAKVYVVTSGEITVTSGESSVLLRVNDSCLIPANETRTVKNESHLPASMVVVLSRHAESA